MELTQKQKAKELVDRFRGNSKHTEYVDDNRFKHNKEVEDYNAKKCALICVDEKIKTARELNGEMFSGFIEDMEAVRYYIQ